MSVAALIEELKSLGVKLSPEGDRLRCSGPTNVLTPRCQGPIGTYKPALLKVLTETHRSCEAEEYGPGRPSPENADRSVTDRLNEARELLGELIHVYNENAASFEFAGLNRVEAERLAMQEVKKT